MITTNVWVRQVCEFLLNALKINKILEGHTLIFAKQIQNFRLLKDFIADKNHRKLKELCVSMISEQEGFASRLTPNFMINFRDGEMSF